MEKNTVDRAGWIPKATNTLSKYVIVIAFPLHQWLHELTSVFRYTKFACFGNVYDSFSRYCTVCLIRKFQENDFVLDNGKCAL